MQRDIFYTKELLSIFFFNFYLLFYCYMKFTDQLVHE